MTLSRAEIPTQNAVSLLRKLCRHWAHKFPVEFDDTHGKITLPKAYVTLMSAPAALSVYLETADPAEQGHVEDIVAEHLQRFATDEALTFYWLQS